MLDYQHLSSIRKHQRYINPSGKNRKRATQRVEHIEASQKGISNSFEKINESKPQDELCKLGGGARGILSSSCVPAQDRVLTLFLARLVLSVGWVEAKNWTILTLSFASLIFAIGWVEAQNRPILTLLVVWASFVLIVNGVVAQDRAVLTLILASFVFAVGWVEAQYRSLVLVGVLASLVLFIDGVVAQNRATLTLVVVIADFVFSISLIEAEDRSWSGRRLDRRAAHAGSVRDSDGRCGAEEADGRSAAARRTI
jgi:hypothetical protein